MSSIKITKNYKMSMPNFATVRSLLCTAVQSRWKVSLLTFWHKRLISSLKELQNCFRIMCAS